MVVLGAVAWLAVGSTPTQASPQHLTTQASAAAQGASIVGDTDCSGGANPVDAVDALQVLRRVAGVQPYAACIDAGNVKCDDGLDAVDAVYILKHVAAIPVNLPAGCPQIGSPSFAGTTLTQAASPGDTVIQVASVEGFHVGDYISIDAGQPDQEDNQITGIGSLHLSAPLQNAHGPGTPVTPLANTSPIVHFYQGPLPYHELPRETSPGHDFVFTLTFENSGPGIGFGPYIDLYLPTLGIDNESAGGPCDGIWFVSADAVFTTPQRSP